MITKFQKFNLIKESPDTLYFKDGSDPESWEDDDAIPFFVTVSPGHEEVNDIFIGGFGNFHSSIGYNGYRREKAYPGRLWLDRKVMSFWVYPNEGLFKDIIQNLEKELNTKIFNNGWRIEVLELESGKLLKQEFDPNFEPEDYFFAADDTPGGNYILIPVEKYIGSEDVPEEIQIQHLMKWQEKEIAKKVGKIHFGKWGSYKTGWDQPHNIKWRQAIYQESKNNLIKESPDKIITNEYELGWSNYDARPFMMTVNNNHTEVTELILGPEGWAHLDLSYPDDVAYAGRLWINSKVMSFWVYPNVELFKNFIEKLEKELNTKIFNNGWKIEVIETEGEIKRRDVKKSSFDYFFGTRDVKYSRNYKIIPIEKYVGSEDVPEEEKIKHLMSWQEKELSRKLGKLNFPDHFGSKLTAWDSPHNIKWRQSIYQENKKN